MSNAGLIAESIYKTLCYFQEVGFPLTKTELFRYAWMPPRIDYTEFDRLLAKSKFTAHDGYYVLPGGEALVQDRRVARHISERKLKKVRFAVKLIRAVPFLRAVFVCNSVGAGMARPESDIDFFIVTETNRIWIVRLFTNLILRLFRLRTYGKHEADRICLSFYVDAKHLNLAPWRVADDDIHFAYWLYQMVPVYDQGGWYTKLLQANRWVEKYIPNINHFFSSSATATVPDGTIGSVWKKGWEAMWRGAYGDQIETEAKKIQALKMKFSLQEKARLPDHGVVIADGVIKLHEHDTRREHREKWLKKISLPVV